MEVKAFAPANISCIFSIVKNKDPARSGSTGVGFTVNEGVLLTIKKTDNKKNTIKFNNKKIKIKTVNSVIEKLSKKNENFEMDIKSKLPFGAGFGLSGASALASAYAINKLLKLKKTKKELAMIAHVAEVENGTGLGDVVNQYYGGFLVKFEPSYRFKVKRLPIKNKVFYYKIFGKLDTKKIITNKKNKNEINNAALKSLKKIKKFINNKKINKKNYLSGIINISKEFSVKSNLLKNSKVKKMIENIEKNNGNASMIMLGNAVFSDKHFKGSKKLMIRGKGAYTL